MKASALPRIGVVAIAAVTVFGAGASVTWIYLNPVTPPALAKPTAALATPVEYQEFSDERTVALTVTRTPSVKVPLALTGRVTSSACAPGGDISSGSTVLSINERPVIALATSVPMWRDLGRGDRGADVKSLQTEFARLGFPVVPDGSVGTETLGAAQKLFSPVSAGEPAMTNIPASRVLWIPAPTVHSEACAAVVGATVAAGDPAFTIAGTLARVAIAQIPADLVAGERTLTVGSASVSMSGDGVITDAAALNRLAPALPQSSTASTEGAPGQADGTIGDGRRISGQISLTTPVTIGVVPPTAVYAIAGSSGCVCHDGEAFEVTIAGSQLGQTYVQFPDGKRPNSVDLSEAKQRSCG